MHTFLIYNKKNKNGNERDTNKQQCTQFGRRFLSNYLVGILFCCCSAKSKTYHHMRILCLFFSLLFSNDENFASIFIYESEILRERERNIERRVNVIEISICIYPLVKLKKWRVRKMVKAYFMCFMKNISNA